MGLGFSRMGKFKLETPVLFMVFSRLDSTKKVFEGIRVARPKKLFIACDGARNSEEKKKVDEVRKFILDNIDWNCEVKTLFRKKNLGCGLACSGAVSWFFENIEEGIILEDDCLPNQDFFRFCQEMLEKYKDDNRVMHVGGSNFISNKFSRDSYYFTRYPLLWGWASWRRAWKNYDFESHLRIGEDEIREIIPNVLDAKIFVKRMDSFKQRGASSWDPQWCWAIWERGGMCICPKVNLIENLGFSGGATHTHENFWDKFFLNIKRRGLKFPLRHPSRVKRNRYKDFRMLSKDVLRVVLKKVL